MPKSYSQICPIARALDILGDRWTLLIIRDLFLGKTRFQQFLRTSHGLPPRLLSDRLKKLEQHGIIERVLYSQYPLRAEYRLTDTGRSLDPVVAALFHWGLQHCFQDDPDTAAKVAQHVQGRLSAVTLARRLAV